MMRYALIAALVAIIALGGALWWQTGTLDDLRAENDTLSRELAVEREAAAQAALARAVEAAHREREARRAANLQRVNEALLTGDFTNADTPIDPRIADLLDCLRRTESGNSADCAGNFKRPPDPRADQ